MAMGMLMDMPLPFLRSRTTSRRGRRSGLSAVDVENGIRARAVVAALVHAQGGGPTADFLVVAGAGLPAVAEDVRIRGRVLVGVVVAACGEREC